MFLALAAIELSIKSEMALFKLYPMSLILSTKILGEGGIAIGHWQYYLHLIYSLFAMRLFQLLPYFTL